MRNAAVYGDEGADTLGHIAERYPLHIPNLVKMGLFEAYKAVCEVRSITIAENSALRENYGKDTRLEGSSFAASEKSKGKDTISGHWEMMGVPVLKPWLYMPYDYPSFPKDFLDALVEKADINGFLGNKGASGTVILDELGREHINLLKNGEKYPILYTSADSVMQIAAFQDLYGLENLYNLCKTARKLLDDMGMNIGRVIARPFTVSETGAFLRTGGRHDYSVPLPSPSLLKQLTEAGYYTVGIGKIPDIYSHEGISKEVPAAHNEDIFKALMFEVKQSKKASVIMSNFVDFDMMFGHRRDVVGYAKALEKFDEGIVALQESMSDDDLLIVTADHGCDPVFKGTEHTREFVPVLLWKRGIVPQKAKLCDTFAVVGKKTAEHIGFETDLF